MLLWSTFGYIHIYWGFRMQQMTKFDAPMTNNKSLTKNELQYLKYVTVTYFLLDTFWCPRMYKQLMFVDPASSNVKRIR